MSGHLGVGLAAASYPTEPVDRRARPVRHEEKITVYVSAEELLALEQARPSVRSTAWQSTAGGSSVRRSQRCLLISASAGDSELVRRLSRRDFFCRRRQTGKQVSRFIWTTSTVHSTCCCS